MDIVTSIPDTESDLATSKRAAYEPLFKRPPCFENIEQERQHRKERLAAGFRIFAALGFSEGVAGHITARDPEFTDTFWVNPFGMHFAHVTVSDLIRVDGAGDVVEGTMPVNVAAFAIHHQIHAARPDGRGRARRPLYPWQGVVGRRPGARPDHAGRLRLLPGIVFFDDTRVLRSRRQKARQRGSPSLAGHKAAILPQSWPAHRWPDRRRGRLVVHLDGTVLPGAQFLAESVGAAAGRPQKTPAPPAP